jgi:hypothetical protein
VTSPSAPVRRRRRDRGSVTVWTAIVISVVFVVVGLVVDGGAMIHATQRADSIAREAARIAGQWVDMGSVSTHAVTINQVEARNRAEAFLDRYNCAHDETSFSYGGDGIITVTCELPYQLILLGGNFLAHGQGAAQPLRIE